MSRRTLRKPTRWTPEEWAQVERAAAVRGMPPLRYVREAALRNPGHAPAQPAGPSADEVAAMRAEIAQLREELQAAKAA